MRAAETTLPLPPGPAPPRLECRSLGTGTSWSRGGAAPADGNCDFRKLECFLGNISAHSSTGGRLGAGGRLQGTPKTEHACTHAHPCKLTRARVCTRTHTHMYTHAPAHVHTCKQCTLTCAGRYVCIHIQVHTCTNTCVHMHTYIPAKPLTHQPRPPLPGSLQAPGQTEAGEGGGEEQLLGRGWGLRNLRERGGGGTYGQALWSGLEKSPSRNRFWQQGLPQNNGLQSL